MQSSCSQCSKRLDSENQTVWLLELKLLPSTWETIAYILAKLKRKETNCECGSKGGYMSLEYAMGGIFSEKSDVYSFGVLLLEFVIGKKNTSFYYLGQHFNLLSYAWQLWSEDRGLDLTDEAIVNTSLPKKRRDAFGWRAKITGNWCIISRLRGLVHTSDSSAKLMQAKAWKEQLKQDDSQELTLFSFDSILLATDKFSTTSKLGQGGFGSVYKGKLKDGKEVAVKRLSSTSAQGIEEFKNEIILLSKLQHRNLVKLMGYCIEGDEKFWYTSTCRTKA
ncbi:G-type lectin S-receptor-like serine/threonine-protein kinase At1g61490 [Eucalyptus grandis]|uniref:G-type lectin S-receptor-like serine/threonine-protein kinase At1g61490 n=1 Tax=Eucalyptus grandis TaxID=71139 RepID=UPI00192F0319|nr:G-type lectin S-receptor-like serine/threonine-protein kinase At1g61490 [Eucalyptus grandis]